MSMKKYKISIAYFYNLNLRKMPEITITPQALNTEKNYQVLSINGEIDRDTIAHFKEIMEQFLPTLTS